MSGLSLFCIGNHKGIAKSLNYPSLREYRYWDPIKRCIDFDGWTEDLKVSQQCSVFFLLVLTSVIPHGNAQEREIYFHSTYTFK